MEIPVKYLDAGLHPPQRAHVDDAGVDLYARVPVTLSAGSGPKVVPTGIAVAIPDGYVGLVCSRSGLAAAHGIAVLNAPGVVDPGYRGEVKVILFSLGREPHEIARGDRIAQLLIQPVTRFELSARDELDATARAEGGLGSSGA
jgi:dUTP pyrophosphatase